MGDEPFQVLRLGNKFLRRCSFTSLFQHRQWPFRFRPRSFDEPSLVDESNSDSHVQPFAGSDLDMPPLRWKTRVIGKISSWIDLDSEDETLRMDSETTLKQEIAWANHLSLRACLLPTPKGDSCANYARCVNQILKGKTEIEVIISGKPLLNLQMYSVNITEGMQTHRHKTYVDCVSKMFHSMKPLSEQELMWIRLRDCLYRPLQPFKDNVVASTYELCERDYAKYIKYQRAISKALEDRVPNEKASELTTVSIREEDEMEKEKLSHEDKA